jgi:hypothetical protein
MGAIKMSYIILVGKPERDVRRRSRWKDITKMDLKDIGYVVGNCLQWLALKSTLVNVWGFLEQLSDSDLP